MATTKEISFKFGPMCNGIRDRLNEQGFDIGKDEDEYFELIRRSVNVLKINRYIPDSTADKCFKRLAKTIALSAFEAQKGREE